jgi:hypothetical protein
MGVIPRTAHNWRFFESLGRSASFEESHATLVQTRIENKYASVQK